MLRRQGTSRSGPAEVRCESQTFTCQQPGPSAMNEAHAHQRHTQCHAVLRGAAPRAVVTALAQPQPVRS